MDRQGRHESYFLEIQTRKFTKDSHLDSLLDVKISNERSGMLHIRKPRWTQGVRQVQNLCDPQGHNHQVSLLLRQYFSLKCEDVAVVSRPMLQVDLGQRLETSLRMRVLCKSRKSSITIAS